MIDTCQSSTIFEYKDYAKEETETRSLKGNQYVASGIKSKRITHKTGEQEARTNKFKDTIESSYSDLVIRKMIQQNEKLVLIQDMAVIRRDIHRKLTVKCD